jgi:hypothetical protein
MSFGKSGGTTVAVPEMTPEQRQQVAAQNKFFTETIAPTYEQAVKGATGLYQQGAPGTTYAAQNLAGAAGQAQNALGSTGESALRTGISGLESLFSPDYERQQLEAAMAPAQSQYEQNLVNQQAQFGGTGNLGSARQALAQTQLAGQTQSAQAATAANILKDINSQRAGVGATLAQLGQGGIGQALGAAGQGVTASMVPQDLYNKYASVIFGTPSASYNLGPVGTNTTTTGYNAGIGGSGGSSGFGIKFG